MDNRQRVLGQVMLGAVGAVVIVAGVLAFFSDEVRAQDNVTTLEEGLIREMRPVPLGDGGCQYCCKKWEDVYVCEEPGPKGTCKKWKVVKACVQCGNCHECGMCERP